MVFAMEKIFSVTATMVFVTEKILFVTEKIFSVVETMVFAMENFPVRLFRMES
jgi:hypothetical protein